MAKRLVCKVDEYEKDGQQKGKYVEIGVILSNDNGEYLLLDPTINLAGVLQKQNMLGRKKQQQPRDMVAASIFDNSNQSSQQQGWGHSQQPAQQPHQRAPQQQAPQGHAQQHNQQAYGNGFDQHGVCLTCAGSDPECPTCGIPF